MNLAPVKLMVESGVFLGGRFEDSLNEKYIAVNTGDVPKVAARIH